MNMPKPIIVRSYQDAANAFRDHENMSVARISKWGRQFTATSLVLKILSNIHYLSGDKIRLLVADLIVAIKKELKFRDVNQIYFVPIGNPSGGAPVIARALRGIKGIKSHQIKYLDELERLRQKSKVRAVVLLDDFSGSGKHLVEWWKNVETILRPWITEKKIPVLLALLVLNCKAREKIKGILPRAVFSVQLTRKYNVLSTESHSFTARERQNISSLCKRLVGNKQEFAHGFGECGLLLAFKYGCPNNSLPILWWPVKSRWKDLFNRRGL